MFRVLFILTLGAACTGCLSALPPSVRVTDARAVEVSDEGARLEVTLELDNPNAVPLPLPEASYRVAVDGVGSYAFEALPVRVIPPNGTQTVVLPAAIAFPAGSGGGVAGRRWRIRGDMTYRPENGVRRFLTESGVPLPFVAFGGRGAFVE